MAALLTSAGRGVLLLAAIAFFWKFEWRFGCWPSRRFSLRRWPYPEIGVRLSIQCATSLDRQAMEFSPSLTGFGNVPTFNLR